MVDPKLLLELAETEKNSTRTRTSKEHRAADYAQVVQTLRDKNWTWRAIQKWFEAQGQKYSLSTIVSLRSSNVVTSKKE